ncbi:YceI family protein [Mariniflexile sp.]|uniref:YceI family protein n=1 Tax=Mariniflexile sp. TaxID=1979402 RepID=UPI003569661E
MTVSKWTVDSNQSDVLLKSRRNIVAFLASSINKFDGSIAIKDDQLEDASIEFLIDVHAKEGNFEPFDINLDLIDFSNENIYPAISFKSTSFEKINANLNFLKGHLTINNITKTVELEAVLLNLETKKGIYKALFEVVGTINRKDFDLTPKAFNKTGKVAAGKEINLTANLEFYSNNN